MTMRISLLTVAFAPLALAGCSFAPAYYVPTTPPAGAEGGFKGAAGWATAAPADAAPKGEWWRDFHDPVLDGFESRVAVTNNTILAARAQWQQARALVSESRAALFPSLGVSASANKSGNFASGTSGSLIGSGGSVQSSGTTYSVNAQASWDVDLWGSVRNSVSQARANSEQEAGLYANATLSVRAELATDYLQLRGIDAQAALSDAIVAEDARALAVAHNKYGVGVDSRLEIDQAEQTLANAKSARADLARQRGALEDAIAVLLGENPSAFRIAPVAWTATVPEVPAVLGGELLQRRPDVAAEERAVAAANAGIGIQRAAFFPALSLSGSLGSNAASIANLFSAPTTLWSLGSSLAETIFDGGARRARVRQARAAYDAAAANYRQTALTAFGQVEDALAATVAYREQAANAEASARAARQTEAIARNQARAGVLDPATEAGEIAAARSAQSNAVQATVTRQAEAVALIEAIGGGWGAP